MKRSDRNRATIICIVIDKVCNLYIHFQINDRVTEDSKDIPTIILRKCISQCPEQCTNNGRWMFRNSKNLPVPDKERRLYWTIGNEAI